ncbi:MAG TPA: hemolysin family protein [Fimbriimonadaceae bacterium]|nr:hemolysin family protein [Fimbriimonadaceae bacterium]
MKDKPPERAPRKPLGNRGLEQWIGTVLAVALIAAAFAGLRPTGALEASVFTLDPVGATTVTLLMAGVLVLVLLNGVFVAAETAIELLRPRPFKHLKDEHPKRYERLTALADNSAQSVAACSLASQTAQLAIVLFLLLLAPNLLDVLSARFGVPTTYAGVILAVLLLMVPVGLVLIVFGVLVPRSYATLHPHTVASGLYPVVRITSIVFALPAGAIMGLASLLTARFGGRASFANLNMAEEEILTLVESAEESGEIEQEERELIRSVFSFTDTVAREIMTPRVDLDAMPISTEPDELIKVIQETGHSRIPLYDKTDDQILGIIHAKDLFLAMFSNKAPNLRNLMRPAIFVPENKNLYELLAELRQSRSQMAIVQDEFGGTAGIVTIEDIVEELVGDIVDEYDVEEPEIIEFEGTWVIDGRTHIDDVNDALRSELQSDEFDTIGGYLFGLFGRQPKDGDFIEVEGLKLLVLETDGRRIQKVQIERVSEPAEANADSAR